MKIVGIGDLFIPAKFIEKGFEGFGGGKLELTTIDWTQRNLDELQKINLQVEQGGSEAYEVDDFVIEAVKDADIIITQFCPINRKVIDSCPNLKVVGVTSSICSKFVPAWRCIAVESNSPLGVVYV